MSEWKLVKYDGSESSRRRWNEFVLLSRNATFLHLRDYMDYHADRFADCSWLAFKGNRLLAMLPANLADDGTLCSHGGLTYGGWILPPAHLDGADLLEIFTEACRVWRNAGIRALDYKPIPYIYCRQPSHEDEYALFRLGATLSECNLSATIDLRNPGQLNQLQRRHLAAASRLDVKVEETRDIDLFMAMLAECLRERHDTSPVHSPEEMNLLADRFADNIRFYVTMLDGEPHAGVCVYDTGSVAHTQYIATTSRGRELNLLTPLMVYLIRERYADRAYLDFGISNEDHGRILNAGLLRQKYSYGATATTYTRYHLTL